jgi:hypothetical protein
MITYSWNIDTVKSINDRSFKDAIVQVYWTKTGTDNNKIGSFKGCTSFSTNDISIENFTDIENVTNTMIAEWVDTGMTDEAKAHINSIIEQQCKA